jgi:hypothetical protein
VPFHGAPTIHQLLFFSARIFYIPLVTYFNKVCYDYFKSVKICVNLWLNFFVAAMPRYAALWQEKQNEPNLPRFQSEINDCPKNKPKTKPKY